MHSLTNGIVKVFHKVPAKVINQAVGSSSFCLRNGFQPSGNFSNSVYLYNRFKKYIIDNHLLTYPSG